MSDQASRAPKIFLCRHGETEWAKSGRSTGTTDIDLTERGIEHISSVSKLIVGPEKLIDPSGLALVIVSPRQRATRTLDLLLPRSCLPVRRTEDVAEWDYGDYEGLKKEDIRRLRKERALDQERSWVIWRDGCEGGESPQQVTKRTDSLISDLVPRQKQWSEEGKPMNILIVSHGAFLRGLAMRWVGQPLESAECFTMDPGSITTLSYKSNDFSDRCVRLGMALAISVD